MLTVRTAVLAATLISSVPTFAHDQHHPDAAAGTQGQTTPSTAPSAGTMGQGMTAPGTQGQGGMMGPGQGMMGSGMMGGNMMGQGQKGSDGMMSMMMNMMGDRSATEHVEGRLAFVKAELKIADAQTAQWNAFAEAVRSNAQSMSGMRNAMMSRDGAPSTLPERLAREDKAVTAYLAGLKKIEDAVAQLYNVLSEDQKKIANSVIVGPMGMPMGMM